MSPSSTPACSSRRIRGHLTNHRSGVHYRPAGAVARGTQYFTSEVAPVGEADGDTAGAIHHVGVGEDHPVGIVDDTGAKAKVGAAADYGGADSVISADHLMS